MVPTIAEPKNIENQPDKEPEADASITATAIIPSPKKRPNWFLLRTEEVGNGLESSFRLEPLRPAYWLLSALCMFVYFLVEEMAKDADDPSMVAGSFTSDSIQEFLKNYFCFFFSCMLVDQIIAYSKPRPKMPPTVTHLYGIVTKIVINKVQHKLPPAIQTDLPSGFKKYYLVVPKLENLEEIKVSPRGLRLFTSSRNIRNSINKLNKVIEEDLSIDYMLVQIILPDQPSSGITDGSVYMSDRHIFLTLYVNTACALPHLNTMLGRRIEFGTEKSKYIIRAIKSTQNDPHSYEVATPPHNIDIKKLFCKPMSDLLLNYFLAYLKQKIVASPNNKFAYFIPRKSDPNQVDFFDMDANGLISQYPITVINEYVVIFPKLCTYPLDTDMVTKELFKQSYTLVTYKRFREFLTAIKTKLPEEATTEPQRTPINFQFNIPDTDKSKNSTPDFTKLITEIDTLLKSEKTEDIELQIRDFGMK